MGNKPTKYCYFQACLSDTMPLFEWYKFISLPIETFESEAKTGVEIAAHINH